MNYFNASVELLKTVPDLEQSVKILERKKQRLMNYGQPSDIHGTDYSKAYVSSGAISDTEKSLIELSQTIKDIQTTKALICEIKGVVAMLPAELRQIIEMWFFKQMTKEDIAAEIFVESVTTVYSLRNKAVAKFAVLYYGGKALGSV